MLQLLPVPLPELLLPFYYLLLLISFLGILWASSELETIFLFW